MDALFLALWADEQAPRLIGQTVRELSSRGTWRFSLVLDGGDALTVCLERFYPCVVLDVHAARPRAGFPGGFDDAMRGARIETLEAVPGQRVLTLTTDRGRLVVELLAQRPAIAWIDPSGVIVHAHEQAHGGDGRLGPGAVYAPPRTPPDRPWPGVDRRNEQALALDPHAGWGMAVDRARSALGASGAVFVSFDERTPHLGAVPAPGEREIGSAPSVNAAVKLALRTAFREERTRADAAAFEKSLTAIDRRLDRTLRACRADLDRAREWPLLERYGSAILAAPHLVRRGQSSASLADVFDAAASPLVVPIDPKLSPTANASSYIKRAQRGKRAVGTAEARLQELEREQSWLGARRRSPRASWPPADLAELEALMKRHHVGRPASASIRRDGKRSGDGFHPRRYRSRDGWVILVGRNNAENDWLTHRLAKADDVWFHAQGVPGSHVVLRRDGRKDNPSRQTIEEAASLAAVFSKARHSSKVPVMYTLVKYVWKPRKSAPGVASCTREKSVLVAPANPSELVPAGEDARE